jgi:L,D-peptidoglycan transpeptidase YkuD (ErfK/YbiS/YcfS/YnhG family)
MSDVQVISNNILIHNNKTYRCAVGENGFTGNPKEGDKATPLGVYPLRECWWRLDRLPKPKTVLPLRAIRENDGWCDDPASPHYNRHVKLPFAGSHEKLWLPEHVYDIIVPIGFNDNPVVPGRGSAIFFHLAQPGYSPTLGCIAVGLDDMLEILARLERNARIAIAPAV